MLSKDDDLVGMVTLSFSFVYSRFIYFHVLFARKAVHVCFKEQKMFSLLGQNTSYVLAMAK